MQILKKIGGVRIGSVNASWPFATLKVEKEKMELKVLLLGKFIFLPKNIVSIEKYGRLPFFGWGIKINHNLKFNEKDIVFWTLGNPKNLIHKIEKIGFINAQL